MIFFFFHYFSFPPQQEKRIFTNFHRQLFCWIDRWVSLTMEDIRRMEDETQKELEEVIYPSNTKLSPQHYTCGLYCCCGDCFAWLQTFVIWNSHTKSRILFLMILQVVIVQFWREFDCWRRPNAADLLDLTLFTPECHIRCVRREMCEGPLRQTSRGPSLEVRL